jgi:hypothetical protein
MCCRGRRFKLQLAKEEAWTAILLQQKRPAIQFRDKEVSRWKADPMVLSASWRTLSFVSIIKQKSLSVKLTTLLNNAGYVCTWRYWR